MGQHADAELQLRAAVALSPLNVDARNKLGKRYFDSGRLPQAEEQFRHSAESEANWTAYAGLGDIYTCWNEGPRAEQAFRRALELNPYESRVRFSLGSLYASAGRREDAIREYQVGLETDPANAEARAILQKLRSDAGKTPRP
jgi:tetratricopeptide (TPR) repeat protein